MTANTTHTEDRKREKFVTLAEKRVNRAIRDIRLIANLANRSNYRYQEDDVRKIFRALQNELNEAKARFLNKSGSEERVFRLR